MFPKLRNRVPQGSGSSDSVSDKEEDEATDYVFRILFPNSQSEFGEIPSREANKYEQHSFCICYSNITGVVCHSNRNLSSLSDLLPLPLTE